MAALRGSVLKWTLFVTFFGAVTALMLLHDRFGLRGAMAVPFCLAYPAYVLFNEGDEEAKRWREHAGLLSIAGVIVYALFQLSSIG